MKRKGSAGTSRDRALDPRPGEIIVKLKEGDPVRQIPEKRGVTLWRGRDRLDHFDGILETPGTALQQSFPRFVAYLGTAHGKLLNPSRTDLERLDHFLSFLFQPDRTKLESLLAEIRSLDIVAYARAAMPDFAPPEDHPVDSDLMSHQGYLGNRGGIDALYSWTVRPGGDGGGVTVAVCDSAFQPEHTDLPQPDSPFPIEILDGNPTDFNVNHGTCTLGVLAGLKDGIGVQGICHASGFKFSTTENRHYTDSQGNDYTTRWAGFRHALDEALSSGLEPGDVVLLEAQQFVSLGEGFLSTIPAGCNLNLPDYDPPEIVPPEANRHVRAAMNVAAEVGFVIVEAAGNALEGNAEKPLSLVLDDDCEVAWNPDEKRLPVIMVGGGHAPHAAVPHRRRPSSNWGDRVDCQGWGENVVTTTDTVSSEAQLADWGTNRRYTKRYSGTSSGSAMVAGVVACLQGAHRGLKGSPIGPTTLQPALRDPDLGTPEVPETGYERQIGPLPDLYKLLRHFGLSGDVFARDHLTDDGTPPGSTQIRARSPDIIALTAPVSHPQTHFVSTWDNPDLSQIVRQGGDYAVYVRGLNRGPGPDKMRARLWLAPPAPFLHPRDWKYIGESNVGTVAPFDRIVSHPIALSGSSLSPSVQHTLVSELYSEHVAHSGMHADTRSVRYLRIARETNDVRILNVLRADVPRQKTTKFRFFIRGIPEATEPFTFSFHLPLPTDTKFRLEVNDTLYTIEGEQVLPVASPNPSNPLDWSSPAMGLTFQNVLLGPVDERAFGLHIVPSATAPLGKYAGWLDQSHATYGHMGRLNFEITVLPPT